MKKVTETIYIANDGKKFLDENECKEYDENEGKIRYFLIYFNPVFNHQANIDYKDVIHVATYHWAEGENGIQVAEAFCEETMGNPVVRLKNCVKRFEFVYNYKIVQIEKKGYFKSCYDYTKTTEDRTLHDSVFISCDKREFTGMPKPFDWDEPEKWAF